MRTQGEPTEYFGRDTQRDFFWYAVNIAAISVALPQVSTPLQIENDSDFFWIASSYQAQIAGAPLTESTNVIPLIFLELQDTGSGRNFQNTPIALAGIAGDGKRPYRLIRPRRFGANTTINMKWTNPVVGGVVGGTVYTLQFILHGYKIYRTAPVPV